jgi:hypothetical protein
VANKCRIALATLTAASSGPIPKAPGSAGGYLPRAPHKPAQAADTAAAPSTSQDSLTPSVGGGQIAALVDPKILIGPNAGFDQSNVASILTSKIDPRLEEASRLRTAGNYAGADRLSRQLPMSGHAHEH